MTDLEFISVLADGVRILCVHCVNIILQEIVDFFFEGE